MSDGKALARNRDEKLVQECLEIWTDFVDNDKSHKQIAEERNISERTVSNRIDMAKEIYLEQIKEHGDKYTASVSRQLDWLLNTLKDTFRQNRDPQIAAQIRGTLQDIVKLWGLAAPPKAPVNKFGDAVVDKLIIVMNDSQYKQIEQGKIEVIDGEIIKIEDKIDDRPKSNEQPITNRPDEGDGKHTETVGGGEQTPGITENNSGLEV